MTKLELVGENLFVRNAHPKDAEPSFRWFANPEVTRFLPLGGKGFLPMERIVAFLEKASTSDRPDLACGIELKDGRIIGCGGYRNFIENESAEVSLILGEPDIWSRGYGREALDLLLGFAFSDLNLKEIWLIVRRKNKKAIHLFERTGFRVCEGEDIEIVQDGETIVKHKMNLKKSDWSGPKSNQK